ncbi:TMhelix containing protein [Vibrio phage 1.084.O._10N.261.49.F5]|nr:TMhelix containing protein [Vibrio phage 1.084.O._10N.261.49.F5]
MVLTYVLKRLEWLTESLILSLKEFIMELVWIIYIIDVICGEWSFLNFLTVSVLICSIMGVVAKVYLGSFDSEDLTCSDKEAYNFMSIFPYKYTITVSSILLIIGTFLPTQETAYKMLAAYGVVTVTENPDVQEIMGEGLDVLKLTLKDYKEQFEK